MVSGLKQTPQYFPGFSITMASCADSSTDETNMLGVDPLSINAFNDSLVPISDLSAGPIFASQKKVPKLPIFPPSTSPKSAVLNRSGASSKGPSLVGGFVTECSSLSSFDLELSLLEQALRKDGTASVSAPPVSQARPEKKCATSLLEPEFYFSDILGDNGASSRNGTLVSHEKEKLTTDATHPVMGRDSVPEMQEAIQSPISDSSMSGVGIGSHPDLYENLSEHIRQKVDRLQCKISAMPRRKLRESLARGVSIEDVEPLMCVNRDELAGMLGLGVTTWKMFVHHTLGIPRWPARALKSQQVKERKLLQKKLDAEQRGEFEVAERVQRELTRLTQAHMRRRKLFRNDAKLRVASGPIGKKGNSKRVRE